jgi:hypothetical protein
LATGMGLHLSRILLDHIFCRLMGHEVLFWSWHAINLR